MDPLTFEPSPFSLPDPRAVVPHLADILGPDVITRALTGSILQRDKDRERLIIRALAPLEAHLAKLAKDGTWTPGKPTPFYDPMRSFAAVLADIASSHRTLNSADVAATITALNAISTKLANRRRLEDAIAEAVRGGVTPREEAAVRAELEPVIGSPGAAILTRHAPEGAARALALVRAGDAACRAELGTIGARTEELLATMLERRGDAAARVAEVLATDISDPGIVDRLIGRRVQERLEAARRAEADAIAASVRAELAL